MIWIALFLWALVVILIPCNGEISRTPKAGLLHEQLHLDDETYSTHIKTLQELLKKRKKNQKIVLKRSTAQSHCVRSYGYKEGEDKLQLDISCLRGVLGLHEIKPQDLPRSIAPLYKQYKTVAIANVQCMTSMEELVDHLLPRGWLPAVVPEFKGITAGGAIQGLAAESSSFRFGFFHNAVVGFDALLANGELLRCTGGWEGGGQGQSGERERELFYSLPGSYGTLAICTSAQVVCIPAAPYVELEVTRSRNTTEAVRELEQQATRPLSSVDYTEGIAYRKDLVLTIAAKFAHEKPANDQKGVRVLRPLSFGQPWFYLSVRQASLSNDRIFMCTKDYLFRHDRGSFWMASHRIPSFVGRFMGAMLDSSNMFRLATALPWVFDRRLIALQDCMLPLQSIERFVEEVDELLGVWPLWLLPMRNLYPASDARRPVFALSKQCKEVTCNVGVYGLPPKPYPHHEANVALEQTLTRLGGRKVYYSHAFYSKEDFYHRLHDGERYFRLRDKFGSAEAFPEIYDKVITKSSKL